MIKKGKRIFVFIDAENMRNSAESHYYSDLDYEKLYDWFKNKLKVKRVYLYVGIEKGDVAKEEKFKKLSKLGYFIYSKQVMSYYQRPTIYEFECDKCKNITIKKIQRNKKQKANCDSELTLDVINSLVRKKCDEIIVFSGDGDFAKLYEYVSLQMKKTVTIYASYDKRTSLKIKEMNTKGVIKLLDVTSLYQHYAERITVSV